MIDGERGALVQEAGRAMEKSIIFLLLGSHVYPSDLAFFFDELLNMAAVESSLLMNDKGERGLVVLPVDQRETSGLTT